MSSAAKAIIEAALKLDPDDREQIADALRDSLEHGDDEVAVGTRLMLGANIESGQDVLDGATWLGESAAELIEIIRNGREQDDPAEAPRL